MRLAKRTPRNSKGEKSCPSAAMKGLAGRSRDAVAGE
jgi:hypothetical protein